MNFIIKVLITAVAVYLATKFLPGVKTTGELQTIIIFALILALLNTFIKPILIVLTIPVTILTLGLFLLIINALMVKWADQLVDGFSVDNWWTAILFSLIVSFVSFILQGLAPARNRE